MKHSPLIYLGGKGILAARIVRLLPDHHVYVEPFGGGASVLFAKPPSRVEVYNDLNGDVVNFFRVPRDPKMFKEFQRLAWLTPFSREEHKAAWKEWRGDNGGGPVERAHRLFTVARQSFSGNYQRASMPGWRHVISGSKRDMSAAVSGYLGAIEHLEETHRRLFMVQIEKQDFRVILDRYDTPDTCFYLDPPYAPATRRDGHYDHEMTVDDHRAMVELLLKLKGMAVLSGYDTEVYQSLEEAGWLRLEWQTSCYSAGRTRITGLKGEGIATEMQPRTEIVWRSPRAVRQGRLFK